jgi:hypothetical protein
MQEIYIGTQPTHGEAGSGLHRVQSGVLHNERQQIQQLEWIGQ